MMNTATPIATSASTVARSSVRADPCGAAEAAGAMGRRYPRPPTLSSTWTSGRNRPAEAAYAGRDGGALLCRAACVHDARRLADPRVGGTGLGAGAQPEPR